MRTLLLKADAKNLETTIWRVYFIDITKDNSIGLLLSFDKEKLNARTTYRLQSTINISKVNVMRVVSNISTCAFINDRPTQVIYEFTLAVDLRYRIFSVP